MDSVPQQERHDQHDRIRQGDQRQAQGEGQHGLSLP